MEVSAATFLLSWRTPWIRETGDADIMGETVCGNPKGLHEFLLQDLAHLPRFDSIHILYPSIMTAFAMASFCPFRVLANDYRAACKKP